MKKTTRKPSRKTTGEKHGNFQKQSGNKFLPWMILLLAAIFVVAVRSRLAPLPLERDEGEYAYMGQCILDGIMPYQEAANMKLPGVYFMYAAIMGVFGENQTGIHVGLMLVNLLSMFLLFLLGKKLVDDKTGAIAAAAFGLFTAVPGAYGLASHATHFIALFGIAGFLTLLKAKDNRPFLFYALGGLMFGLAFIMKQQAVFLLIFGGLLTLMQEYRLHPKGYKTILTNLAAYSVGALLPYLVVVLIAFLTGSFATFWHWTVEYAGQYNNNKDFSTGVKAFSSTMEIITPGVVGLWLAALLGLVALFVSPLFKESRLAFLLFALCSFLCTVPGFYFRNHYFIAFFPALALLVGLAFRYLEGLLRKWKAPLAGYLPAALFLMLAGFAVFTYRGIYFQFSMPKACVYLYGENPFLESVEVAGFIKKNTREDERIIVFGSEPQIYFYSNRKAATTYLYTYPLMENQPYYRAMQEEMKTEIERSKPKYIVFINCPISWLANAKSDNYILKWYEGFVSMNYHLAGFADMISPGNAKYVWGQELNSYSKQGRNEVVVMERN